MFFLIFGFLSPGSYLIGGGPGDFFFLLVGKLFSSGAIPIATAFTEILENIIYSQFILVISRLVRKLCLFQNACHLISSVLADGIRYQPSLPLCCAVNIAPGWTKGMAEYILQVWRLSLLFGAIPTNLWTLSLLALLVFTLWNTSWGICGYFVDASAFCPFFYQNKRSYILYRSLLYQVLTEFGQTVFESGGILIPRVIFDARYNIWNSDFKDVSHGRLHKEERMAAPWPAGIWQC